MKKCSPTSKEKLKNIAIKFRKEFDVNTLAFPVIEIIDKLHCKGLLNLFIVNEDDSIMKKDELAFYELNSNSMFVKEHVYLEAIENIGRARLTLTHELSHYLLLYVLKFEVTETKEEIKTYEDPEWQANYLASELLAPRDLTQGFNVQDYISKCNISEECAIVIWNKRRNE